MLRILCVFAERMRLLPDYESRRTFHERVLLEQLQAIQRRLQQVHAHETQHGSATGQRIAAICNGLHFILTALRHYNNDFVCPGNTAANISYMYYCMFFLLLLIQYKVFL